VSRFLSEAVTQLAALNSTLYFVRTFVNEFAEMLDVANFIYLAVILSFIQMFLLFVDCNMAVS
jgi:hypothetical protein